MADRAGQTCGKAHTKHRCFYCLDDAWRDEFGDDVERPHWAEMLRSGVAIFDLDYDAIPSAMYYLSASAEGDCYRCVPLDPGIDAAALGASESILPGTAPAKALHTFTLDSGASRCFFRDSTTLTPLRAPVPIQLADPSGGPGSLPVPSLSSRDAMVTTTTRGGQRVSICTCTRTGRHLAMFTRRPGLSLYTLATEPPQVAASAQVSASGQVASPCSCRLLSHQTLLWHHRLGQLSLPHLRGMHSRLLVSGLPRSLPPLPTSLAPPCLPSVEGRKRIAPKSSSFPPKTAPPQTLHMDMWDPARVSGQGRERYFLLVVDAYTRYTTIFPLRSKGQVVDVLIPWICAVRLQLRERFSTDLLVHCLHSDRGAQPLASCLLTIDESVPFYRLFPYRSAPPPPPTLFRAQGPPPVEPLLPQGPAPSGVSQVDPVPSTAPVEVDVGSGVARGAVSGGAASGGAEPGVAGSEGAGSMGAEPRDVEPGVADLEGVELGGTESEGAESGGAASSGGPADASPRLSPQQLRVWLVRHARLQSGATGAPVAGAAGAGGTGVTYGAGGTGGIVATGPGAGDPTEPGAARAGGSGAGGARAGGVGAGGTGAGAGGGGAGGARAVGPRDNPASPLPAPSIYTEQSGGFAERHEPASHPVSPVRPAHRVPRLRPPPVPSTHAMALRPSSVSLRVPPPAPPESCLPEVPDPESDCACAAIPAVSRLLATAITDPSFETAAASSLVAELLDFVAACRLDYAIALVVVSEFADPSSVGGECALGTDALEDRQENFEFLAADVPRFASMLLAPVGDPDAPDIPTPRSYAEAITGPYSSQWQAAMDAEMASWKSTSTYVDKVPPPGTNIVDGMWIFRVKRPPGSLPTFKARYVARGFSQRQGVDFFQTFSPTPKMTTLRVLLHVAAHRDYELHSLDFSTAFLQGSLHEEIWLRRPPGFTRSFPAGTLWSLWWPFYGLYQAPHKWHDTLRTTLAALGFAPSTADPSLFLRTDTLLPPFYILVYIDDLVFATVDTEALTLVKLELQKRHICTDLGEVHSYLGLQITRDRARRTITLTQSHMVHQVLQRFGFQFSSPQPTPLSTSHSL
ncbi:unnamed protein product [Closterium sp. NIES-54]